jgi:hypothetical protein
MKPPDFRQIDFAIPTYWSPEQALAVFELLDDLRDKIWAHYGLHLQQLLAEQQPNNPPPPDAAPQPALQPRQIARGLLPCSNIARFTRFPTAANSCQYSSICASVCADPRASLPWALQAAAIRRTAALKVGCSRSR